MIAVEVPGHAGHSGHDADPGFPEFSRLADVFGPEDPLVYGGQVLHAVWPARRAGIRARAGGDDGPGPVLSGLVMLAASV